MPWIFNESTPIYLQIIDQVRLRIAVGEYKAGDKLLPVRELAAEAEVNPNTMQKALSELERSGLVFSQRTAGRYITDDKKIIDSLRNSLANEHAEWYLSKMSMLGYSKEEALTQLNNFTEGESK